MVSLQYFLYLAEFFLGEFGGRLRLGLYVLPCAWCLAVPVGDYAAGVLEVPSGDKPAEVPGVHPLPFMLDLLPCLVSDCIVHILEIGGEGSWSSLLRWWDASSSVFNGWSSRAVGGALLGR